MSIPDDGILGDSCRISIEPLSPELLDLYAGSGMERGTAGRAAIDWIFASNPEPFAVLRDQGRILGVSGYVRNRMTCGGQPCTGFQAIDSFVSDAMRGRGIFRSLAEAYDQHVRDTGGDLVWGFPNANAAHVWFARMGWTRHGQVPFLIRPLRSGYFFRKLGIPLDFPIAWSRDQNVARLNAIGDWADRLWEVHARGIGCAVVRDTAYLQHRLFEAPHADAYRVVADPDPARPALVATRTASKHGGEIGYLMEAMGDAGTLRALLVSEMGRLRDRGVELMLAWCYPWSPNYRVLRKSGFLPLPERLRPISIWFGARPCHAKARPAADTRAWYLSYLDSDTV